VHSGKLDDSQSCNTKGSVIWDMMPCSHSKVGVSEENVPSVFKVEEQVKQETGMKQAFSGLHGVNVPDDRAS
jgi:hypothetical protein